MLRAKPLFTVLCTSSLLLGACKGDDDTTTATDSTSNPSTTTSSTTTGTTTTTTTGDAPTTTTGDAPTTTTQPGTTTSDDTTTTPVDTTTGDPGTTTTGDPGTTTTGDPSTTTTGTTTDDSTTGTMDGLINGCDLMTAEDHTNDPMPTVESMGLAYSPKCIIINTGSGILFSSNFASHPLRGGEVVNGTKVPDPGSPITPTDMGMDKAVSFPDPGAYGYYCDSHALSGMTGVVFVVN